MDLTEGLILSSMMGNGGGSGGGGNPGYHVETQTVTIVPQQSVTTVENPEFGVSMADITATIPEGMTELPETLNVVVDGTLYVCTKAEESNDYGATPGEEGIDWSEYPFVLSLAVQVGYYMIATPTAGTHTVYAYAETSTIVTDEDFNEAVTQVVSENVPRQIITVRLTLSGEEQILNSTYEQIWNYYSNQGLPVYISWVGFVCRIATGTRTIYVIERGPNGNITDSFPFNASADDAYPKRNVPSV